MQIALNHKEYKQPRASWTRNNNSWHLSNIYNVPSVVLNALYVLICQTSPQPYEDGTIIIPIVTNEETEAQD